MSQPVNLNKVRKARARADKRARADQNAASYGRTKAEKSRDRAEAVQAQRRLDQHRRDTTPEGEA